MLTPAMQKYTLCIPWTVLTMVLVLDPALRAADADSPSVVSHVKVLSDKVEDVSSLEAWKKSFIKDGMSDQEKALAVFKSSVMFQYQDSPPAEFLQHSNNPQDPIRVFNVYGYSMCNSASANVESLARYTGLQARGWGINGHSVSEVFWDGSWRLLDSSLINYFPKPDGKPAGVEEIVAAVTGWLDKNPDYKGNDAKLRQFHTAESWKGWKKGPELLANCPFYDANGWWPAKSHGWYATMQEYDGTYGKNGKPFIYEYGSAAGYQVNIQLRQGERLTRRWSNKGLHINMDGSGGEPYCLKTPSGTGMMKCTPQYGDLAPGRVGNGTLEYTVPLAGGAFRAGALTAENLACTAEDQAAPALHLKDPAKPGVLVIRMPSSYIFLSGELSFKAALGEGGALAVSFSENNGLDWKELAQVSAPGEQKLDLKPLVYRRYDYRLKFELKGKGTGLDTLKIAHDIQHSQRPLPILAQGENTITFSAGPAEGTLTVQGNLYPEIAKGKQLVYTQFHPALSGMEDSGLRVKAGQGEVTFPIATPGEMVRLRIGAHYRARDKDDGYDILVSFDGGKSFKSVDRLAGPTPGTSRYLTFSEVPAGSREALVKFSGQQRNTTCMLDLRMDADYKEPHGGFAPVKVTYTWEENGQPKQDAHVAKQPNETWTIKCDAKPLMKEIVLELAP